jgi:hypothetical protein
MLLVALLVLAGVACSVPPQQKNASEEAAPADQITPDDVALSEVHLLKSRDGSGYHVEGQVQNNAPKLTLKEFKFQMVMQDCLPTGVCKDIAQDTATIAVNLPAGQSGAFEAEPDFSKMPAPQGTLGWHYAVVSATAAQN